MKYVYLYQEPLNGCIESFLDFGRARAALVKEGYDLVDSPDQADFVLCNSCVASQVTEDSVLSQIDHIKARMKSGAELVVTGCLPKYNSEALRKHNVDFEFSPGQFDQFLQHFHIPEAPAPLLSVEKNLMGPYNRVNWAFRWLQAICRAGLPVPAYLFRLFDLVENSDMCFIRISRGCLGKCTYCATRISTGTLRSLPPSEIIEKIEQGLSMGKTDFTLCGEDTGAYGQDLGVSLPDLLARIFDRGNEFTLNIRLHDPHYLIKYLPRYLDIFSDRRAGSICLPIQSGSNRILKAMRRRYTTEQLRHAFQELHRRAPNLLVRTHIIVGFPGETEDDFRQTMKLVRDLHLDMVLPFPFAVRPSTAAAAMPDRVGRWTKSLRMVRLTALIIWKVYLNRGRFLPITRQNPLWRPSNYLGRHLRPSVRPDLLNVDEPLKNHR